MTASASTERRRSERLTLEPQPGVILRRQNSPDSRCHIRDFSQHGALLRRRTGKWTSQEFRLGVGNAVDICFFDRSEPNRSGAITGNIVRINEDDVAVDYSNSDAPRRRALTALLQRQSEERSAKIEREELVSATKATLPRFAHSIKSQWFPKMDRFTRLNVSRQSIFIVSLVLGAMILGAILIYSLQLRDQLNILKTSVESLRPQLANQNRAEVVELARRIDALEKDQGRISTALTQSSEQEDLRGAVERLRTEVTKLQQATDKFHGLPVRKQEISPMISEKSTWVVHIMTVTDLNSASQFIARAKALGIKVDTQKTFVGAKEMYRLFVPGIKSPEAATKLASDLQKRLSLTKRPWIAKQ